MITIFCDLFSFIRQKCKIGRDTDVIEMIFDLIMTIEAIGAVVVAQLIEQSLPTPEVCGSNPVIIKLLN